MYYSLISQIDKAKEFLSLYQTQFSNSSSQEQKQLLVEADKRLNHLKFILEELRKLQEKLLVRMEVDPIFEKLNRKGVITKEEMEDFQKRNPAEKFQKQMKLWDELVFFTESFYYQAFRFCKCIEKLPNLDSFKKKYKKVSFVRNKLIEHPEILSVSVSLGGDTGPVLKNSRNDWEKEFPQDKGLNLNAIEFLGNVIKLLSDSVRSEEH